jgi:hypothetical protein
MLGITTGAVRIRLSCATLPRVREGGTVYVLLPADMSRDTDRYADDVPTGMPYGEPDTLTSELRDRLRYVEGQLEAERQAHSEARKLLAAALERIPAIEAPQETQESPETVDEQQGRGERDAPLRYGRGSGRRTEAARAELVEEGIRWLTGKGPSVERDEWMSEQVAGEIEDLRRRFGFVKKEAVAYWHLRHARQLMSEMGQTDHFEELEREGKSELEADFREFAGLIHDISVLGETRVFQHFAALYRELGTRVLRRNYPDGWGQPYASADEES